MTDSGVIPRPEDRPQVQLIGHMRTVNGAFLEFSTNGDGTIRIAIWASHVADLDAAQCEEFSRLYFETVRQAEATMPP